MPFEDYWNHSIVYLQKDSDTSKPFESSLKRVCEIYPEYQELAGPMFTLVMGDSVDNMLSDGILSMEKSTEKATKIMELCEIMVIILT